MSNRRLIRSLLAASFVAASAVMAVRTTPTVSAAPTTSPAADMPADWFLHDSDEMAAPQKPLIGKPAPAIKVSKWYQNEVDLSPTATKGKVVILDIWATWCVPCKIDMPKTDELAKKLKDQPVVFATICSDGEDEDVTKFVADKKLSLPMAKDDGTGTYDAFAGQFMPTYVAIDKRGVVRAIGFTHAAMEKIVEKLLAEPA